MARFIVRRLIHLIPTLFGVSVAVFLFVHAIPGSPAIVLAGPNATASMIHAITLQMGLNQPLPVQYVIFLVQAVRGDFGNSLLNGEPTVQLIAYHFMPTAELALAALGIAVVVGVLAGVIAAAHRGSRLDLATMTATTMGISLPPFWLAMLLVAIFAVALRWVPAAGDDGIASFILPAVSLAAPAAAGIARYTRSSVVSALVSDHVRTARSKGVSEAGVLLRHGLRTALLPIVTVIGLQFAFVISGAVVIEVVFAWPGIGMLLINAVESRDYPTIQTLMLLFALEFVFASLCVDILYAVLDPRIQYD
jgi:glutathione transport system permease protein